jgi:hypothetical protein
MRDTAEWYRSFAEETRGQSAIYERWALSVADDRQLLALIDGLPLQKRQPNLLFACSRFLGAPEGGYVPFRDWLVAHWDLVVPEVMKRMTQTNEPRRCAALLPALGLVAADGPVALLEVGASAGLCLYPDRYSYSYDGVEFGPDSAVRLECATSGAVPLPVTMPEIVWRCGIDLDPLDVRDAEQMRWLTTLPWPEQEDRRLTLGAAIEVARDDPPTLVRGDATARLAESVALAPDGARVVVVVSGVLVYLTAAERAAFVEEVRALGVHWIALEGRSAIPSVEAALPDRPGRFVLSLNERPFAFAGARGEWLDWF